MLQMEEEKIRYLLAFSLVSPECTTLILWHKLPPNLLNHLEELRFALSSAPLLVFLLEQIDAITETLFT